MIFYLFFFNDTATTEIYTLSLHDALPIWQVLIAGTYVFKLADSQSDRNIVQVFNKDENHLNRSEEHTSELQSRLHLVCRLLLEKKKWFPRRSVARYVIRWWIPLLEDVCLT